MYDMFYVLLKVLAVTSSKFKFGKTSGTSVNLD